MKNFIGNIFATIGLLICFWIFFSFLNVWFCRPEISSWNFFAFFI